jgi:hypothetical protein
MSGPSASDGPGSTAATGPDASPCLRDQLAEAIDALRWQAAVMRSHSGPTPPPRASVRPVAQGSEEHPCQTVR